MELALLLEEYFNIMLNELRRENATVDKFIGDSIMAFWGAPVENTKHTTSAIRAVWNCTQKLNEFNKKSKDSGKPELVTRFGIGKPELVTRFGIASGDAVVGNVGASARLNYTVLGDNVNLASRIEGLNKFYGTKVLATSEVVSQTKDVFMFRHVDRVAVKGKVQVDEIFELLGPYDQVPDDIRLFKVKYEEALNLYFNQDFFGAMKYLNDINPHFQEEGSVQRLKDSCDRFIKTTPGKDWKDVHIFNR
jgi:adenylate cyclase